MFVQDDYETEKIYKDGQYLSYVEYEDGNGYPILIQHGLIASIDDYESTMLKNAGKTSRNR